MFTFFCCFPGIRTGELLNVCIGSLPLPAELEMFVRMPQLWLMLNRFDSIDPVQKLFSLWKQFLGNGSDRGKIADKRLV